jgi:heavy metal sensor kinase
MEFVIWRSDGTVLTRSEGQSTDQYVTSAAPAIQTVAPQVTKRKGMIEALMRGPHGTRILVLRTLRHDLDSLHRFGFQIAGIASMTLLVGIVGGWWISGRLVQPIRKIADTASQISAANLHQRIETRRLDQELIQLAAVLNQTFERLEQSFGRLTQFTADASHELRTPLAVIQSQIELALSQPRSTESYQQTLATCLSSSERMRSLIDGLLLLARTDANHSELRLERLDLRRVAEDAVAQLHDKAVSADVDLHCSTPEEAVMVSGDSRFLGQVPANLIDNAIQHTPAGGTVMVEVRADGNVALLSVSDTGCGIAEEHLPHLFDRFYRVDVGRSRHHGGSGLGLAICKSLVEAHSGTISCESTVAKGCTFVVRLPLLNRSMATNLEDVNEE